MGDYEVRDNWGRKVGAITPSDPGSGCLAGILVVIVLAVGLPIAAIYGIINSVWVATHPPPWHVVISSDDAQHSGNFATNEYSGDITDPNGMENGASLTFTDITPPSAGTYTLTLNNGGVQDWTGSDEAYTLTVIVNGEIQVTYNPVEGHLDSSFDVRLSDGSNTIQLTVEGHDATYYGDTTYVVMHSITLDQKTT